MSKIYIYSTLTADQAYKTADGPVLIQGGANLATRRTLDTPRGVVTTVTEAQYEALKRDSLSFAKHIENGWITADTKKVDPNEVADGLAGKDKSAQKTEADLMKRASDPDLATVSTGKKK
jgi:hypothetical protein